MPRCSETAAAMFLAACQPRRRCLAARLLPALVILAALWFSLTARGEDWNARVLAQIESMPRGGGYQAGRAAYDRLTGAIGVRGGVLAVQPAQAAPSFCSEATYLVFLKTIAATPLAPPTLDALPVQGQPDGHGVWGRWNANGPGTARLFRELGLGRNFDDFAQARPGDFMKIFWSSEVGRREHGHSVIFLGCETQGGVESVRFWSSNAPGGYGIKSVPRTRIAYAIFSRLEHPEALNRLAEMPAVCPYLARLGAIRSSRAEAKTMVGI
ncbi:MAG: hypothetical protein PHQ12_05490 [Chthoniobacteraceae bacterium]|nr:hypothetical protein [Chthoniobacteraceae bacterium]